MDVLVSINDCQEIDGEKENISLSVVGTFTGDENDYTVEYPELDGDFQGCTTKIRCENKYCVTIFREGPYSSELILEQKKRHSCYYFTPYGELTMGIFAREIDSSVNHNGGVLKLNYTIDFNAGLAALNTMIIKIEPQLGGQDVKIS